MNADYWHFSKVGIRYCLEREGSKVSIIPNIRRLFYLDANN
jgi:hypothetical protein